jgi:hypothetical protein
MVPVEITKVVLKKIGLAAGNRGYIVGKMLRHISLLIDSILFVAMPPACFQ